MRNSLFGWTVVPGPPQLPYQFGDARCERGFRHRHAAAPMRRPALFTNGCASFGPRRGRIATGSHAGRSLFAAGSRSGRVAFASAPMRPASSRAAACLAPAARRAARGVRRYFPTPQKFQAAGPPHAPDGGRPISFLPHGNKPRAPPCTRPGACASVRRRIDRHARCCLRAPRRAMRGHGDRACFRRSIDTSPTAASRRASTPAPGAAKRAAPRRPTDTERES